MKCLDMCEGDVPFDCYCGVGKNHLRCHCCMFLLVYSALWDASCVCGSPATQNLLSLKYSIEAFNLLIVHIRPFAKVQSLDFGSLWVTIFLVLSKKVGCSRMFAFSTPNSRSLRCNVQTICSSCFRLWKLHSDIMLFCFCQSPAVYNV